MATEDFGDDSSDKECFMYCLIDALHSFASKTGSSVLVRMHFIGIWLYWLLYMITVENRSLYAS